MTLVGSYFAISKLQLGCEQLNAFFIVLLDGADLFVVSRATSSYRRVHVKKLSLGAFK